MLYNFLVAGVGIFIVYKAFTTTFGEPEVKDPPKFNQFFADDNINYSLIEEGVVADTHTVQARDDGHSNVSYANGLMEMPTRKLDEATQRRIPKPVYVINHF
jgi:hypothetical protein